MVKILYFGRLSDRTQCREETIDLPDDICTINALKTWLGQRHDLGDALNLESIKTMINQELVHGNESIANAQEIGFLPPVGGG
ncbi:MAG: molybdopterin synthase sulfur carrier subunit [Robiginitomaculum sp.]|nr:MAG: molybdopterin synthase sulfur carrier subunit [Robiginitomaculum sp.]